METRGTYRIGGPLLARRVAGGDLSIQLLQELIKYWGLEPGETYKLSEEILAGLGTGSHQAKRARPVLSLQLIKY